MNLRFAAPIYPNGRHCLLCGTVTVGAVFPPATANPRGWAWRVWVTDGESDASGVAKSEAAAKSAVITRFERFLTAANLQQSPQA